MRDLGPRVRGALVAISASDIAAWERRERAVGYADSSLRSWRALLHLDLADAIEEGLIPANPAARRRGRGRRVGRSQHRAAEKVITTALGVLLIAERAALLSGRDDEFAAVVLMGFTGVRWGELVGLETEYVRSNGDPGRVAAVRAGQRRVPPLPAQGRVASARAVPGWLVDLLKGHIGPNPADSRARATVGGMSSAATGRPTNAARQTGPTLGRCRPARRCVGGHGVGRAERPDLGRGVHPCESRRPRSRIWATCAAR